ncbi:MAG: DNA polymerase I [Pseudomonadota bacterium]
MASTDIASLKPGDHLFLVDGSSYIFRAYHALPPLTRKTDGLPVGAVSGFCNMIWKLMREQVDDTRATHLAVIFDHSGTSFRNDLYDLYKANRDAPPEDLRPQFGLIREATRAFGLPCVEQENYEADDLIATYARLAEEAGADVTIVASDKDLMQLVSAQVTMYDTMKDRRIGADQVVEKFGVTPDKVVEVQALAGDSVDNIPGAPGIGVKTAAQLIETYGDVETLLGRAEEIKQPKRRQTLIDHADAIRISRRLVELERYVPLETGMDDFTVREPDPKAAIGFLKFLQFTSITRRVADALDADASIIEPTPVPIKFWEGTDQPADAETSTPAPDGANLSLQASDAAGEGAATPQDAVALRLADAASVTIDRDTYETITTLEALDAWIAEARANYAVVFDVETTSLDAMQADLVGVALATAPGRAAYVPLAHTSGDDGDLFGRGASQGAGDSKAGSETPLSDGEQGGTEQIAFDTAIARLKSLLEDPSVLKIAHNAKYDLLVLSRYGITVTPIEDTLLISYVLDAGMGGHGMDELSRRHFGHEPIPFKEVAGSGKSQITFDRVPIDTATAYAAEDGDVTYRLWRLLKPRLAAEQMTTVYERLERPLVPVLTRMERHGIKVDRQMLARLSGEFAQKMAGIEDEIYALAGERFTIGSPKQLGEVLFEKLGLPGAKKTKTGAWTTGASVLEDLAAEGHALPGKVLDWRGLQKLKSTYTDALPGYINPETGRVHTSFSLAATTTGRLSSSDPNIQNIPVRTEEGRRIRKAFIAEEGSKLVSADYSQIELRVLAHIAEIDQLKQAFADGLDIHAMTASEMFGVPVEGMDPMVRRRAKAINFGIIYGISAFGLANQLSIPREEASTYIKRYFERFPGIKDYMDRTKALVREQGFVTTIFGRKCHYPAITKGSPSERAFFERAAINAPIQGSAADIIRRAMVRMEPALSDADLNTKMLLQVHDELIFEVPDGEVDATLPIITKVMEDAALPALDLSVPLKVDARAADTWDEAH